MICLETDCKGYIDVISYYILHINLFLYMLQDVLYISQCTSISPRSYVVRLFMHLRYIIRSAVNGIC